LADWSKHSTALTIKRIFSIVPLNNTYPGLHFGRVFAMLFIFSAHLVFVQPSFSWRKAAAWEILALRSQPALIYFFVLTGFLIVFLWKDAKSLFDFFSKRFLRLLPLYFTVLLILFWKSDRTSIAYQELFFLSNMPFSMTYIMPWSWSLSVDEQIYILSGLIWFLWKRRTDHQNMILFFCLGIICAGIELLSVFSRKDLVNMGEMTFMRNYIYPTWLFFDAIFFGMALAFYSSLGRSIPPWKIYLSLVLAFCLYTVAWEPWELSGVGGFLPTEPRLHYLAIGPASLAANLCFVFFLIYEKGRLFPFLRFSVFRYLASLTYSFYLIQIPVIQVFGIYPENSTSLEIFFFAAKALVVSLVLSYALHLTIEKPIIYLRTRFLNRRHHFETV